jgi:hypothetical protein
MVVGLLRALNEPLRRRDVNAIGWRSLPSQSERQLFANCDFTELQRFQETLWLGELR